MIFETTKDEIITLEEFQELLQVGRTTAYQMLSSGEIRAFKVGRHWKIPRATIDFNALGRYYFVFSQTR